MRLIWFLKKNAVNLILEHEMKLHESDSHVFLILRDIPFRKVIIEALFAICNSENRAL